MIEESEQVSFQWFTPHVFAWPELSRHADGVNACVESPSLQGQHPPFAPTDQANPRALFPLEPIHQSKYFLDFESLQGSPHEKSRTMQEFPVAYFYAFASLALDSNVSSDERWYDDAAAAFCQPSGKLAGWQDSGRQPCNIFRGLIGVGYCNDVCNRLSTFRLQ